MNNRAFFQAFLIAAGLLASAGTAAAQDASSERAVSVLMRVSRGDGEMPMSGDWLQRILVSDGVFGLASRHVLQREPEPGEIQVHFIVAPEMDGRAEAARNQRHIFGTVTLIAKSDKVSVEQLRAVAKLLGSQLQAVIERLAGSERERLVQEMERFAQRREEVSGKLEAMMKERRRLREAAGVEFSSSEAVRKLAEDLQAQKSALDLQLIGQKARTEALTRRIAELSAATKEAAESDIVAKELARVLEVREAEFAMEQKRVEAGQSSQQMLKERMAQVALARVEVLRARSAAAGSLHDQLARLNGDLVTVSVEAAETEARRAHIDARLADFRKSNLIDLADLAEWVSEEFNRLRDELNSAERGLRGGRESIDRYSAPSVELIGLETPPSAP